jgi:hypothetical protein
LSLLACLGRHTVTGMLTCAGRQFCDWSADYRLFAAARVAPEALFAVNRREVAAQLAPDAPLVVAMDDTLLRKTGRKIPGVAWRRDPLGPPFRTNLVRAQRFIQRSAALMPSGGPGPCRMVPIGFDHAPSLRKPGQNASAERVAEYKQQQRQHNLSRQGADLLVKLRADLDRDEPAAPRILWVPVDGSYTNRTVLGDLPERTVLIGRIRGDARLFHPFDGQRSATGRPRRYGARAPTPEGLRRDEEIPWQRVEVFAAGKLHQLRIKTLAPVLWKPAGYQRPLRLIVIAPLAYRPSRNSRLLYREPAYLVVTDPDLAPEQAVQAYLYRWDIEVNHRDEKQLIGVGQAQVRSPASARNVPAFAVAVYGMLLLAATRAFGLHGLPGAIPPPRWRRGQAKARASTADLISHLRHELWAEALQPERFSGFADSAGRTATPQKLEPDLTSALLYAA